MKGLVRAVAGNVVWNRQGEVWALYRVAPVGGVHETVDRRMTMFDRLRTALMRLPAESMLLSIGTVLDPFAVLSNVLPGAEDTPFGRDVLQRTEPVLCGRRLVARTHYLALRVDDTMSGWRAPLSAATAGVGEWFGIPPTPSRAEIKRVRDQAAGLVAQLGSLTLTPATAGEVRWLHTRALQRGIGDVVFDDSWEPAAPVITAAAFHTGEVVWREGGQRSDPGRTRLGRYVKAETDRGVGFHTCLVMSAMPSTWTFPYSGDVLAALEAAAEVGEDGEVIEADVCVRIRRISNQDALRQVRRKRSKLAWQHGEYAGAVTGTPTALGASSGALIELEEALETNRAEPELQATVIIHLADPSLARLERHAAGLQAVFEPANYGLVRPIGEQTRLLTMCLPGSPTTAPAADFRQHLLARDVASCLPYTGGGLGDPTGGWLGTLLDTGLSQPVLIDPARGPSVNRSGNLAAVGGLGAGKSVAAKRLIETVVAVGGQVITIDRTDAGEYVRYASALQHAGVSTQVIRLGVDTGVCLDPLRIFDAAERVTVTFGFLAQLAAVDTGSLEATILAEAVETIARRTGRIIDVIDELRARAETDPEAGVIARKLARFARMDALGRVVFGDGTPLDLTASFVVISAAGLDLVSRDVLVNEHLARKMLDTQVAAQALLYLTAAVARRSTFGDRTRFAAALLDEFWGLAASPHGAALIREWLRDSRKHHAAVWLFSQHAADFDDAEIRSFLGTRLVFRQHTPTAATAALAFLDAPDSALAERLTRTAGGGGFGVGMCVMSDLDGRVGVIQVHESLHPTLRAAANTNPTTTPADPAAARHLTSVPT